jgi:hypothetical protein
VKHGDHVFGASAGKGSDAGLADLRAFEDDEIHERFRLA